MPATDILQVELKAKDDLTRTLQAVNRSVGAVAKQMKSLTRSSQEQAKVTDKLSRSTALHNRHLRAQARTWGTLFQEALRVTVVYVSVFRTLQLLVRGIRELTFGFAEQVRQQQLMARQFGVSTRSFIELQQIAELFGVTQDELNVGLRRFVRAMDEVRTGVGEAQTAMRRIGISNEFLAETGGDVVDAFLQAAKGFEGLETAAEKGYVANKIFEESGQKLIPVLEELAKNGDQYREILRELGSVPSEKAIKVAERFEVQTKFLKFAFVGLRNEIAENVLPILTNMFTKLRKFLQENRKEIAFFVRAVPLTIQVALKLISLLFEKGRLGAVFSDLIPIFGAFLATVAESLLVAGKTIWFPLGAGFKILLRDLLTIWAAGLNDLVEKAENVAAEIIDFFPTPLPNPFKVLKAYREEARKELQGVEAEFRQLEAFLKEIRLGEALRTEEGFVFPGLGGEAFKGEVEDLILRYNELAARIQSLKRTIQESRVVPAIDVEGMKQANEELAKLDQQQAKMLAERAGENAVTLFQRALDELKGSLSEVNDPDVQKAMTGLLAALQQLWVQTQNLNAEVDEIPDHFQNANVRVTEFLKGLREGFGKIGDELENAFLRGRKLAKDFVDAWSRGFDQGFLKLMENGFRRLRDAWKTFAGEVLKGLAQIAAEAARNILVRQLVSGVTGLLGGGGGERLPIEFARGGVMYRRMRAFQYGGVATEPTVALFGERSNRYGEAFVPLGPSRRIPVEFPRGELPSGNTLAVNLTVPSVDAQSVQSLFVGQRDLLKKLMIQAVSTDPSFRKFLGIR